MYESCGFLSPDLESIEQNVTLLIKCKIDCESKTHDHWGGGYGWWDYCNLTLSCAAKIPTDPVMLRNQLPCALCAGLIFQFYLYVGL